MAIGSEQDRILFEVLKSSENSENYWKIYFEFLGGTPCRRWANCASVYTCNAEKLWILGIVLNEKGLILKHIK